MEHVSPGQLNVRISIKKEIKIQTSTGEKIPFAIGVGNALVGSTFTVTDPNNIDPELSEQNSKFWAKVADVSGDEEIDGKIIATNVRTYVVRYRKCLVQKGVQMFVVDEGEEYNITSVAQIGRKKYLQLKCYKRE